MKCISVRQPWAWAIIHAGKDIENRSRDFTGAYRGQLLIHASKTMTEDDYYDCQEFCERLGIRVPMPTELPLGGLVGTVILAGVLPESRSRWFVGPYGLLLVNPKPLPFTPVRGRLGLFDVDFSIPIIDKRPIAQKGIP